MSILRKAKAGLIFFVRALKKKAPHRVNKRKRVTPDVRDVMHYLAALNSMIRRNSDEGHMDIWSVSDYELECLHKMRAALAAYYGTSWYYFEPSSWALEHTIKGEFLYDELPED